jgi:hypothetical protein
LEAVVAGGPPTSTTWDSTRVAVAPGSFEARGFGYQGQSAPRQMCGLCVKNYLPPIGHGPASSTDNRRVINVVIDSSWEGQPEELNPRILAATLSAIDKWNTARTIWGKPNGYFLHLNNDGSHEGGPDITIFKNQCPTDPDVFACLETAGGFNFSDYRPESWLHLPQKNTTTTTVRDEDLAGRLAHEFAHKFGAWSKRPCDLIKPPTVTILDGSFAGPGWASSPRFGQRSINQVTAFDVELVNQALMASSTCTATSTTPVSEPTRQQ